MLLTGCASFTIKDEQSLKDNIELAVLITIDQEPQSAFLIGEISDNVLAVLSTADSGITAATIGDFIVAQLAKEPMTPIRKRLLAKLSANLTLYIGQYFDFAKITDPLKQLSIVKEVAQMTSDIAHSAMVQKYAKAKAAKI